MMFKYHLTKLKSMSQKDQTDYKQPNCIQIAKNYLQEYKVANTQKCTFYNTWHLFKTYKIHQKAVKYVPEQGEKLIHRNRSRNYTGYRVTRH